jgi:hypothetical protein
MTTPITNALDIVTQALHSALSPLVGSHQGNPKCYWLVAEQGATLPYLVYQSQDLGGRDASMLNVAGWEGEITIKSTAVDKGAAQTLLATVPAAMEALANPSGFTLTATFIRPLVIPAKDTRYTAALIYKLELFRS